MINIKVFSDFACPFCYIGFSIADRLRKENKDVNIQYFPYELDPDMPKEGGDLIDSIPQEQIDMSYRRIERLGKEYGLIYKNKTRKFNTTRLHKASLYAEAVGKFYEFSKEAFRYIFEFGKNVGDPLIINEIGLYVGLDIMEMNKKIDNGEFDAQMEEAKKLSEDYNIESVPTFIVNEEKHVTLLKDYEKFKKDLLG